MTRRRSPVPAGAPAPTPERYTREQIWILSTMCLGTMVTFLQITASVSSLGAVGTALDVSPGTLVWVPSAYTLAVASLVLSAGTLGNLHGRRRVFCLGALVLALGAALVVSANGIEVVILGQLLAGAGGALLLPNSLAIVAGAFDEPHRRTDAITIWAAASGVGLAVGALVAGLLIEQLSWNAAFVPTALVGLVVLVLALVRVPESTMPGARLDVPGLGLGTVTVGATVYALIEAGRSGYASPLVVAATALAAASLVVFVAVERRTPQPMLDVRLFSSPSFSTITLVAAVALFGFTGIAITQVLFYERAQGLSALDAGWRILPMFVVYVAVAALAGRLVRRTGFVAPLAGGLVLGASGAAGLLLTQQVDGGYGTGSLWFAMFGAGVGLVAAPSTAAAMVSVAPDRAGMASGSVNAARQVGSVMGSSILGALLTNRLLSGLPSALAEAGVPPAQRAGVQAAVTDGTTTGTPVSAAIESAIGAAFSGGVQAALGVIVAVFLVCAVLVVTLVRNRPHHDA